MTRKKSKVVWMEEAKCIEMKCQWYNDYDKKCRLSGALVKHETYCIRYAQWKKRRDELANNNSK